MTNRTKAILGLGSVFTLGLVCGALIFGIVVRDRVREQRRLRDRDGFVNHFVRRLELSEAQRDSLRDELEETYAALDELRASTAEQYNALLDTFKIRIAPHLTAEQRELLKTQEADFRKPFPREMRRRGPHGGERGRGMMPPPLSGNPGEEPRPLGRADSVRSPHDSLHPRLLRKNRSVDTSSRSIESGVDKDMPKDAPTKEEVTIRSMRDRRQEIARRLKLTDEQRVEIFRMLREARQKGRMIAKELEGRPLERRQAIRSHIRELVDRIVAQLNDEQRAEFRKIQEEAWNRFWKKFEKGTGGKDME